ncbi:MAG: hypothetical protein ACN6OI_17215 [Flavobacterium sp.]|jgi:hypothetical protein|uniref:hypothetical protein n=1 Tax=Flavobacterium sp. TaxID=239 RepID=UPI003D139C5F
MSRIRIVGGTITKTSKGATTIEVLDGHFKSNAAKENRWIGEEKGNTYHEYKAPEKKVEEKKEGVKEIECLTTLDFGSTNDKADGVNNPGMIFGKTYHFRVKSYLKDIPKNKLDIKWLLKYHNLSENKWEEISLSVKGDSVKITMNEKNMCGRFVYVRAYVKDHATEAELKIWKHNRFRWFNRMKVYEQIENRVKDPWKIDQGNSSLCGMASLYYAMAKKDSKAYEKLAKELYRTGEYTVGSYVVKPHDKALSMYETKPTDRNYVLMKMHYIDWIVLATTRSKESLNSKFVYTGFENGDMDMLKAVNWPDMLTRMCKEVAGFKNAESFDLGLLQIANKKGVSGKLNDAIGDMDILNLKIIDRKYKEGHTILMMIDSSMIEDSPGYNVKDLTTDSHWVVYEGGLNFIDVGDSKFVGFNIYTWGFDPVNQVDELGNTDKYKRPLIYGKQKISVESFKSNYYGYIEVY